jgi:hypothetical protein
MASKRSLSKIKTTIFTFHLLKKIKNKKRGKITSLAVLSDSNQEGISFNLKGS